MIAGVRIFDTIAASKSGASLFLIMMSLPEERSLLEESLYPIGKRQLGWATLFVTPSPKKNDGNGDQFVIDKPFIDERKPLSKTVVKGV